MLRSFFLLVLACLVATGIGLESPAVEFESFEFNESQFTSLSAAVNGSNGGNNWSDTSGFLTESEMDGAGNFRINKFNDDFAPSYLQITNIDPNTVGSRFITVEISGWDIRDFDAANLEEVRFAFLNDDTGTSGSTVAAQMQIARSSATEMEIQGDAIGVGSSDLSTTATFGLVQSSTVTMVLELNKTSNTYEVFYKDGANPSQSLGIGEVAPSRDGNSVRLVVNNNFGFDLDENLSINRIAVADQNPLTDLVTLEIDRNSGSMKLINTTGAALSGLESVAVSSSVGALDSTDWKPITDNYDNSAGPGDGSVDADDDWQILSATTSLLSESVISGDGGNLSIAQEVLLSADPNDGPWIQNPTEDVEAVLTFAGGVTRRANVNFVGNGGERLAIGDLDFDGLITEDDWTVFIAGAEQDLSSFSEAQAYGFGDLNNDGENNIFDFGIFETAFDDANGLGSFQAMLAGVPEPSTLALLGLGAISVLGRRQRGKSKDSVHQANHSPLNQSTKRISMTRNKLMHLMLLPLALSFFMSQKTYGGITEDFEFNDSNGTLLASTTNSVVAGDDWDEDATDMLGSQVLNGVYRVQKDNENFGTNYLDTTNFTTGKAWIVTEVAGWNFTPTLTGLEEAEQIRMSFLDNDTGNQGGSTITGQWQIQRNASDGIELVGRLTTGAPEFGPFALTHNRTDPFTVVLEIDEDSENYSVYYKDDTDPFVLLGTAPHVAGRDGNSVRFVANNGFNIGSEFFDIDRIYVTDENPISVDPDLLTLQVNLGSGSTSIVNNTTTTFDINSYRLSSSTVDSLYLSGNWSSFNDNNLDPVDGPDADSIVGNGIGETWDEAAGSDNDVLAESFLLGSSSFTNGRSELLGNIFNTSADPNAIVFQYRDAVSGAVVTGEVEFVTTDADFDGDGFVSGLDFLIWQQNLGLTGQTDNSNGDANGDGTVGAADLVEWESQYGLSPITAAVSAVPEPTSLCLLGLACLGVLCERRR